MEEVVDDTRRTVIVECKHTHSVSRPVVQKLHSAVSTYDTPGPKRGVVVTTGRFTSPAEEYATKVGSGDGGVELIDGEDLRAIGEKIGLDLRNGRIEILCDETLRPADPTGGVYEPVRNAFRSVDNIAPDDLPEPQSQVTFRPVLSITAEVDAVFETSVGVIHEIHDRDRLVVSADRDGPTVLGSTVRRLVENNQQAATELDDLAPEEQFDTVDVQRYGQTETEYKEWAVDRLRERHTTTVAYTGDNNVDYQKECEPNLSDVSVQAIEPLYLPRVRMRTDLGEYSYPLEYYAAGPSRTTIEDGIHECVHCGDTEDELTYCDNCGSINCSEHITTERLEGEPVCTECAVTERFALKTKYFYDEENLETFAEEYEAMPPHEKAMENPPLVVSSLAVTLVAVLGILSSVGVV
jgi:restriction endonuclease Mrr